MSGVEGSSLPQHHLRLQSPLQILRPSPNRHFPFSPAPRPPPAFDPHLFADLRARSPAAAAAAEKDKIPAPELLLKPAKIEDHEVESAEGPIKQEQNEEISTQILPPVSDTGGKRHRNPKPSKHKRFVPQVPGSTDGTPSNALASSSCRYDSSLSLLTKKFVNLLQQAEDGTLDLNRAADVLDVQKRRIYDITNVLEGVGLIEKKLKNRIRWKGYDMSRPKELEDQITELKVENELLCKEESRVDAMIREMQENLRVLKEENDKKWLYLTKEDVSSLPCFQNSTLIAIKAPRGTSIEVPDPDEGLDFPQKRHQIHLRSFMGPINCYLISNLEERFEASNQDQHPVPMDLSIENSCNRDDASPSHQEEQDAGTTSEQGQHQDAQRTSLDTVVPQELEGGIVKIVPSDVDVDADYWFQSDPGVKLADMWGTE